MTFRRVGSHFSLDLAGFHFSVGRPSGDSKWDGIICLRRHCVNGLRFNVGRLFSAFCWPLGG